MKNLYFLSRVVIAQVAMFLLPAGIFAGNVQINSGKTEVAIKENTYQKLVLTSSVAGFNFSEVNTPSGKFTMLSVAGFGNRNIDGEPSLPVYRKLIEVPVNASFSVRIIRQHYSEINLPVAGILHSIIPAQPPMSKGDDPSKVPFLLNQQIYSANNMISDDLATVTRVGTMRAVNLARIDISPVQYNPVEKTLRIYDLLEVEVVFSNANIPATIELKKSKASPYFNSMYRMVENYKPLPPTDELITSSPVTYVIVSDPMFQATLQPFIEWKKKKGFRVIEGYTNNPAVGTTTTTIKAWLQGLYTTPPSGYNVPSFVLFVGDVAQIPAWAGGAGSHVTDLRYCEYTNDNLPEVYYGRFSATSIAQLQPQIDKTLEYEQYTMPDPSFLGEAVMVAGADAGYQTHSNGQIYYGTENYFNAAHGLLSHTYLQPEPSGANYSQQIKDNVSAGVAYANYTAHCSEGGWASPSFQISDIANLTNAHKYCLMVGNCCLSCKFDATSFAEEQLRAVNKGSVGYIGGSNNTYWDEDYWWGCGFKTVVLHPAYDAAHIGAYDGAFHDHGEPVADWFVTQGQMVVCGNYAVEESNTSRKQYYWEIYHLMGDPSLMVYYAVPPVLTATYLNTLMIGMTSLAVNTEPYAYVALSSGGVLLDARTADATGAAMLNFSALTIPGIADVVITRQNRQPHFGTIQVIPATGPYVVYTTSTISDPLPGGNNNGLMDFSETNQLNVSLKNVGVQSAPGVVATLSSSSAYVSLTDNTENYGTIEPDQVITRNGAFSYNVAAYVPDQQVIPFTLQAVSGSSSWTSNFNIIANAPVLQVGVMTVQDTGPGCDNDGILDPGETADLFVSTGNTGHAGVSNVFATLTISGGTSPYLVINNSTSVIGTLAAGGTGNAVFSVTANPLSPIGTPVDLNYVVTGGATSQYSASTNKQVVIGLIPTYNMSNTTETTCTGYFYDSGGPSGEYQDSEAFTKTFYPSTPGSMIRVIFESFSTEAGYDYLRIYDGINTSATLLGTYNGTTGPATVTATNAAGALTFNFTSDGSVTSAGWEATINCYTNTAPPVAGFSASPLNPQLTQPVTFTDLSTNGPTAWQWSFSPATFTYVNGTSATSQNPQILFSALGQYSVTLIATNAYGSDSEIKTNYINVTNCTVSAFPWTEGFENGGIIPNCWTQEQVNSSGLNWVFVLGNGAGYPATAHTGSFDACLKDNTAIDNKTRLITPVLNLSSLPNPQLKFWHTQTLWSPDQDILTVFYKTSAAGTWTQLTTYTGSITAWTQETIALPGATGEYYIAFEGNAKYGRGVCIDDVEISSSCATISPVSLTIVASANPVDAGTSVTFTATPVNGGASPTYQWKVNGTNAGTNSPTYSYIPADGDIVSCMLTAAEVCTSGNPATSNTITMTVQTVPANLLITGATVIGTECYDAVQTITVAGNPYFFNVQPTGHATLIAGQSIIYLPGATVLEGGYMYGYIAPEGPFCWAPAKDVVIAGNELISPESGNHFCQVFPNPTTGYFKLSLNGFAANEAIRVHVYNMQGQMILNSEIIGNRIQEFSLAGNPAGIYLVRLIGSSGSEALRVIKQ